MNKSKGRGKDTSPVSRENWTDPSLKFLDWVNAFEFEKTFIGRVGYYLEKRFHLRYLALTFLGCFGLAYLVFYSYEANYHVQVGIVARSSIKSPINIDVVDDVATESKRFQAELSVPPVFDYDSKVFDELSNRIYKGFEMMRAHRRDVIFAKKSRNTQISKEYLKYREEFSKILEIDVPQRIFEWLAEKQFGIEIENNLIRTLEYWSSEQRISESPQKYISSEHEKIIVRLSLKGETKEYPLPATVVLDLSNRDHFVLESVHGLRNLTDRDRLLLKQFTYSLLRPNLSFNKLETEERRNKARGSVLPIIISLKKNQVIVSEGSIIEPLQIAILEKIKDQTSNQRREFLSLNLAFLLLTLLLTFFSFTKRFTVNQVRVEPKDVLSMGCVTLITIVTCKIFWFVADLLVTRFGAVLPENFYIYAAPVSMGSMIVSLLITYGEIVWLFTFFGAVVVSFLVPSPYHILVYSSISGIMAARGVFKCHKRNDIYFAGIKTGIVNAIAATILTLATQNTGAQWITEVGWIALAGLTSGVMSAFLALAFVPMFENLFGYTTDVKLMELSNLNHPLLQEMIVKAPGTYHHSLVVGSMVEAAAEKIGASPLLAKVMAYYHDIGKTSHSAYFIENQKPGRNPHDHISPYMSKTVLIAHIKDGVELGMKYKLGRPIIDGILQHHGTTLIAYFFNKSIEMGEENDDPVPEDEFRYPGPKPQFKEAALIMLADSIEAAARSLDEPTPMRLQNIVKNIIQRKFMEGQLEDCNLSLKDLSIIEQSFIRTLIGIHHQRIDYPKSAGGGTSLAPEPLRINNGKKPHLPS